jgi:chromosomal replication initiation ATPase DnaA
MKTAINQIIQLTADEFDVTPRAIKGKNKCELLSLARQAAMHICWKHIGVTDNTITHYFGRRPACSLTWARKTVAAMLETNKAFAKAYQNIESKINL